MAGKGSRQRTYGATFNSNYDKIFGGSEARESLGTEWVSEVDQYPSEARELAEKGAQEHLEGDANEPA